MSKRPEEEAKNIVIAASSENDSDFIPLITDEDEDLILATDVPESLPILPLRNTVLFPGVIIPISVGRNKSMKLIRDSYKKSKIIGAVAQKDPSIDSPGFKDLHSVGTVAQILKILEMPDGSTSVIIQGKRRICLDAPIKEEPYLTAKIHQLTDTKPKKKDSEFEAIVGSLKDLSLRIIKLSTNIPPEASFAVKNIESSTFLINFISSNSDIKLPDKQRLLDESDLKKRGTALLEYLVREVQLLELKNDIQSKVRLEVDQQQREYMLHQQMKTIQDELGGNPSEQEIEELRQKGSKMKWNKGVEEVFNKEVDKLQRLNPASGEYSVQLNYVQTLLDLPWNVFTKDNFNLKRAKNILEKTISDLKR
jgi:ATP-dependent Lon protease